MNCQKLSNTFFYWAKFQAQKLDRITIFIFHILAIGFLILATTLLMSLAVDQFDHKSTAGTLSRTINQTLLELFGIDHSNFGKQEYQQVLSTIMAAVTVLVTLWFAVVTFIKHIHNKSVLRREGYIETNPVYQTGKEDLACMLKYFRSASEVTVFSGDFSWIKDNVELRNQVIRLADEEKISFISSKSKSRVKSAISNDSVFDSLAHLFHFNSGIEVKCSIVSNNSNSVLLYKVDDSYKHGDVKVCVASGKGDAYYLLKAIRAFCDTININLNS